MGDVVRAKAYFRYWGKASPLPANGPAYHLLPYHGLDVARIGKG